MARPTLTIVIFAYLLSAMTTRTLAESTSFVDALFFYASLDNITAERAAGDNRIHTAENLERKTTKPGLPENAVLIDDGRFGRALRFRDISENVVMFHGKDNFPYSEKSFSATISFWLRVDPENGLKPGYVDPLQITDKKWNDASLFVDFTKDDTPRHFRLGVFSDYQHWNPNNIPWEKIIETQRPMVVQKKPTFTRNRWTHVALTLANINTGDNESVASLFIDGKRIGDLRHDLKLTWNMRRVAIMLGIQYIGDMDDFAVFDRVLRTEEIGVIAKGKLPVGAYP